MNLGDTGPGLLDAKRKEFEPSFSQSVRHGLIVAVLFKLVGSLLWRVDDLHKRSDVGQTEGRIQGLRMVEWVVVLDR